MPAPLRADSIRARVQYATTRLAAVLVSLAVAVAWPVTPDAFGAELAAAVAAVAGTAAAQSSATPAARPVATATRRNRDFGLAWAGMSPWELFSEVMTTPLVSLRVTSCARFAGAP